MIALEEIGVRRLLAFVAGAIVIAGCGGIVDVVNEYDDGTLAANDGGASEADVTSDASSAPDGGTIVWGAESGTRLKAIWWKTDDGARQFAGWHDDELGQDCTFIHTTDGVDRCVPPAPYIQMYGPPSTFEDAACSVPLVSVTRRIEENTCTVTDPTPGGLYATLIYSAPTGGGSCGVAYEAHGLKKTGALAQVYEGPSCTGQAADPTVDYFEYGDVVPPSTFVGSKTAPESASTRLTFLTRTTDDGARERLNFYDTLLDVSCGAARSADDLMRCMPDTTGDVAIYGDTNCTSLLEHCDRSTSCDEDECGNPVPFAGLSEQTSDCDSRLHIYPVRGTVPDGTQVYELSDTTCSPFYVVENQPTGYVGAELAASTFVPLTSRFVDSPTRLERYEWDPGADGPRGIVTVTGGGHPYADEGWRDGARAESCSPHPTVDGMLRCLPPTQFVESFSDDRCSTPIARSPFGTACGGPVSYLATVSYPDACDSLRLYELGPTVLETSAFGFFGPDDGGTTFDCEPINVGAGANFVTAGADVTSQFAAFSRVIE